jgi:hypothetical protein
MFLCKNQLKGYILNNNNIFKVLLLKDGMAYIPYTHIRIPLTALNIEPHCQDLDFFSEGSPNLLDITELIASKYGIPKEEIHNIELFESDDINGYTITDLPNHILKDRKLNPLLKNKLKELQDQVIMKKTPGAILTMGDGDKLEEIISYSTHKNDPGKGKVIARLYSVFPIADRKKTTIKYKNRESTETALQRNNIKRKDLSESLTTIRIDRNLHEKAGYKSKDALHTKLLLYSAEIEGIYTPVILSAIKLTKDHKMNIIDSDINWAGEAVYLIDDIYVPGFKEAKENITVESAARSLSQLMQPNLPAPPPNPPTNLPPILPMITTPPAPILTPPTNLPLPLPTNIPTITPPVPTVTQLANTPTPTNVPINTSYTPATQFTPNPVTAPTQTPSTPAPTLNITPTTPATPSTTPGTNPLQSQLTSSPIAPNIPLTQVTTTTPPAPTTPPVTGTPPIPFTPSGSLVSTIAPPATLATPIAPGTGTPPTTGTPPAPTQNTQTNTGDTIEWV